MMGLDIYDRLTQKNPGRYEPDYAMVLNNYAVHLSNAGQYEEAMKHTEQSTGILQIDSQAKSLIESAAILRGQIAAQEVELQGMSSYATEKNPQVATAQQRLIALKAQLAKLSGTDANPGSDIMVPKGNIPEAGIEYLRKVRDVKYYETIMELIAKQFEMAKLDEARDLMNEKLKPMGLKVMHVLARYPHLHPDVASRVEENNMQKQTKLLNMSLTALSAADKEALLEYLKTL